MFELQSSFDLLASLSQFINDYRRSVGITESCVITPRIINQEKGGVIIFVWNDVDKDKPSKYVTYFGVYEPESQKHTMIYTYTEKIKVVSCSLNQERTLLAFSIVKPLESSTHKKVKDVYQAYVAELQSVGKIVYSLNMERSTFLKVQFLHPHQQGQAQARESHMLVFLHKESIGLYKMPVARIGDRGIMMSGQPKTDQMVRKFVWCQWDVQNQRLHYIQNLRVDNSGDNVSQKMSTIQFYAKGEWEIMVEIPITFPFPYIRTSDKSYYADIPLHPGIPELNLNVAVLTQPNGTFCLCYHKLWTERRTSMTAQGTSESAHHDVEYYISLVHHAKTVCGRVSNLTAEVVRKKRLVFSWLGSYLLVMLPGHFVHLLNVGISTEPCHHILLHDYNVNPSNPSHASQPKSPSVKFNVLEGGSEQTSPFVKSSSASSFSFFESSPMSPMMTTSIFSDYCAAMKTLLPCQSFLRESGSTALHLYDYRSGCLMKLVLNIDLMLESFHFAYWQTRVAILHYFILHNKDYFAIKKLFEVLAENLTNSEVSTMFTEYLVASTFAEMKKQVDKEVLNLLSFTSFETLRGHVEKGPTGERLAHISYSSLETIDLSKKSSKESKSKSRGDFWDILIRRLRLRHSQVLPRFSHDDVMRIYRQAEMEEAAGKPVWNPMHVEDSFFDGVYTLKLSEFCSPNRRRPGGSDSGEGQSGRRSKLDSVLGPAPLFLQSRVTQESKIFKRRISLITEELLTKHLTKYLTKESHSKVKNVAKEYLYCQAKVTRQLCHLIWSLIGPRLPYQLEDCLLPNLQEAGADEEYELFQLCERLFLTAGELGYPLPSGFSSIFTALGFKCLELHLFFQYVDSHVLVLTPDFILQLLEDLPDDVDEEVPQIKLQVISRLPKPFAEECFDRWRHPMTQQRKAREQVAQILMQGFQINASQSSLSASSSQGQGRRSRENSGRFSSASTTDDMHFPPLDTFLKHMDKMVASIPSNRPITYDASLVESTALYHTKTKTPFDLSTVNF